MAPLQLNEIQLKPWTEGKKNVFRFFSIFFLLQLIPLDWKFYKNLFSFNWLHPHFKNILDVLSYTPKIIRNDAVTAQWNNGNLADWLVIAIIAFIAALIWKKYDKPSTPYPVLQYWLRVLLRYRLAIGLIAYGFYKVFQLQIPFPSISNLNTNYGDFFSWKIYYQTTAIAPNYESFLGWVEVLAGFLLFNRNTTLFGAGLVIGFTGNIAVVNAFYDIGDLTYSTLLVLIAVYLLAYDVPRLYTLLVHERKTLSNKFKPLYKGGLRTTRMLLKFSFVVFTIAFGYKAYATAVYDHYKLPKTPGLKGALGYYNVKTFLLNNRSVPYSLIDPNRWQNVIFERWSTVSIKINRPVKIDITNGDGIAEKDIDRNYELAGLAGRHYYYYEIDTINQVLHLQNKNKNHRSEKFDLHYSFATDSTLLLKGVDEKHDSIIAELEHIDKKYMMFEGRRRPVKL